MAHLVTIAPEIVLCPDVLVRILWLLLLWWLVGLVLPVLVPETISVDAGDSEAWNNNTVQHESTTCLRLGEAVFLGPVIHCAGWDGEMREVRTRWTSCAIDLQLIVVSEQVSPFRMAVRRGLKQQLTYR